jgi:hypothetical protein
MGADKISNRVLGGCPLEMVHAEATIASAALEVTAVGHADRS